MKSVVRVLTYFLSFGQKVVLSPGKIPKKVYFQLLIKYDWKGVMTVIIGSFWFFGSKKYYNIPSEWKYFSEKYQFELCSKYDRQYGFDVILG